jgi:hypothetical protein
MGPCDHFRDHSAKQPELNFGGGLNAKFKRWLPLADALRNFVFDPSPDFLALIHTLRVDPLPGLTAL